MVICFGGGGEGGMRVGWMEAGGAGQGGSTGVDVPLEGWDTVVEGVRWGMAVVAYVGEIEQVVAVMVVCVGQMGLGGGMGIGVEMGGGGGGGGPNERAVTVCALGGGEVTGVRVVWKWW